MRLYPDSRSIAAGLALLLCGGCAEQRDPPERAATWREDVSPIMEAQCVRCHSASEPSGGYALDTYLGALGGGSDEQANVVAGDSRSTLLVKLAEAEHRAYLASDDQLELIERWVRDGLSYFRSGFHEGGVLDAADAGFHGAKVAAAGWDMASCRECHGEDYAGGFFGVSCNTCHQASPAACNTCHGAGGPGEPPPAIRPGNAGAHALHLAGSSSFDALACSACHLTPATAESTGHLDADGRAEVHLGTLASARDQAATYDPATLTCAGVACHGAGLAGGSLGQLGWNQAPAGVTCTSCHGSPPATTGDGAAHPQVAQCELCHGETAGPDLTIREPSRHGDGRLQVLAGSGGCNACHSGPGGSLPFRDTRNRTDPLLPSVGAHTAHLEQGGLAGPYACTDCHAGRTEITSEGHLDIDVQVVFGGAATARGSSPTWDATTGTCSGVACHGAGLAGASRSATPAWTSMMPAVCGDCHGAPPAKLQAGGDHPPAAVCSECHGAVIDDEFRFVDPSLHANGTVEVNP